MSRIELMNVDALHTLVSSAIWRAEQLDELGLDSALQAWVEVSKLEEELAKSLPVKESEGRIARRGAVRAALKSSDYSRAEGLVDSYVGEKGAPKSLCVELQQMLKSDAKDLAEQFPFAAQHHKMTDLQLLAKELQQAGPFGLAA